MSLQTAFAAFLVVSMTLSTANAEGPAPKFGMLFPLSGNYASIGADNRQGVLAALESNKKAQIDVIYADSKADPTTAVSEFRKLLDADKVLGVFAMRGPVGMALNPLAQEAHVALFGGVGNKDFAGPNLYSIQVWSKSDEEGGFIASKVKDGHFKKITIVTTQDDWTAAVSSGFRLGLKDTASKIVFDQDVLPADSDFRALIAQIKLKSPDLIFVNLGLAQLGPFFKQAKEQKLESTFFSNFWISKKEVIETAGADTLEGVRFVEMDTDMPNFRKLVASQAAPGTPPAIPSGATLSAYATTLLISQTIEANPKIKTREEFFEELKKQTEVKTPDGPLRFNERIVQFPLVQKIMRKGQGEVLKP